MAATSTDAAGESQFKVNSDPTEGPHMMGVVMPPVAMAAASDDVQCFIMPAVAMAAASDDVQGFIVPQVAMAAASDAAQGVLVPEVAMVTASDDVQGFIMPQVATAAASDAAQGVLLPEVAMATASDAVQGFIMPQVATAAVSDAVQSVVLPDVAMAAASDDVQGVTMLKTTAPAVSTASEAAQRPAMPDITESIASDDFQGVNTPKIAVPTASGAVRPVSTRHIIRLLKNPAPTLKKLFGAGDLDNSCLEGKKIRQVEPAQVDKKGTDIGGFWVPTDSVAAATGCTAKHALQWFKQHLDEITKLAPSLTYIDTGHSSVSFITLTQIHIRIHTSQYKHIFKY